MGIFDNLETAVETEVVEENVVQKKSAYIKESGAYVVTLKKFWFDQNDNGTTFYNWEGETADGQKISDREWFATKEGKMQFAEKNWKTKELTGKMKDFPGFARLKVIARALTGDADAWKTTERKIIPVYDFNVKADVDKEMDVFVPAIGKTVEILTRRTLEDKTKNNPATGKYEPINEVKSFNNVVAWLDHETHKSFNETTAGTEANAYKKFMEAIEECPILDNRDVSKGIDTNAPKEDAAPSEEAKNAFS